MDPNELSKYGLQVFKVTIPAGKLQLPSGQIVDQPPQTKYLVSEKGGYNMGAGLRELTGITDPSQLQGMNIIEIDRPLEASEWASKYGVNAATSKANLDISGLQNLVNQYKQNEIGLRPQTTAPAQPFPAQKVQWKQNLAQAAWEASQRGEAVDPAILAAVQSGDDIQAAIEKAHPETAPALAQYSIATVAPTQQSGAALQPVNQVGTIPFKAGLTDAQKQSITNIAQNKPVASWNEEDKKNWAYATGGSPLPTGTGTGQVVQGEGGRVYAKNVDGSFTYIPDQRTLENYVFQHGYQDARSSGVQTIPQGTQAPGTPAGAQTGTTGAATTGTGTTDNLKGAYDIIDQSGLPDNLKKLFKDTVALYPDSTVNSDAILSTFNKIKQDTIDPYYFNLVKGVETDLRTGLQSLQTAREQELETERLVTGSNIRQARNDLEARGMTFSGQGIETLGAGAAYAQGGAPDTSAIPTQTAVTPQESLAPKGGLTFTAPFGGDQRYYEGTVNQANRLMMTSNAARQQAALQQLGRQAESKLGTAGAAGLGINYTPAGGQIGEIPEQQQQRYATTVSQLYQNQQRKEDLNTNINPF